MPRRLLLLAAAALFAGAAPAHAQRSLAIERFDAEILVHSDGSIAVTERITVRFAGAWNGIYRNIPIEYRTPWGLNYTLRLRVDGITDGAGNALEYESSRERHYRKLKIWVPGAQDATRTVVLHYRTPDALRFAETHDELYWNVTGDEWEVPIHSASARVLLPSGVENLRTAAFTGAYGSTESEAAIETGPNEARFATTRPLAFREGLTIVVGWDPGVIERPAAADRVGRVLYANWPLAFPVLAFILMFRLWRARGRDPRLRPITVRYEPPEDLSPAEMGTLIDNSPDLKDISATLVDLAVRGYITIERVKEARFFGLGSSTDYALEIEKPRAEWSALRPHERLLLEGIFDRGTRRVELSDLKNRFYKHLPAIKSSIFEALTARHYYRGRPDHVRTRYFVVGCAAGMLLSMGGAVVLERLFGQSTLPATLGGLLSGAIIVGFGLFMPARTVAGTRALEGVLGFEEFLDRVESDRFERVVLSPELFEKYLPHAMALGVEERWARAFADVYREPPRWYRGAGGTDVFHSGAFVRDLGSMAERAGTAMSSSPRSSGGSGFSGGSSGGGFGGGGGGGF